jgi:hypothetical protein
LREAFGVDEIHELVPADDPSDQPSPAVASNHPLRTLNIKELRGVYQPMPVPATERWFPSSTAGRE